MKEQKHIDKLYKEYYHLQNLYGVNWINMLLGNLSSYKNLRDKHTYQEINQEIINN